MHPGYYPPPGYGAAPAPMWHGQPPPGYPPMMHHPGAAPPMCGVPPAHGHYGAPPPQGHYGAPQPVYGAPAPHGAPPGYPPAGPPPHLAGHPAAAAAPQGAPQAYGAAPGQPPAAARPALTAGPAAGAAPQRALDFAAEKPQAYKAFVDLSVHTGEGGTTVGLPNSMCLDRHVADFLLCLECWLSRTYGAADAAQKPWRLQCLDLSRNSLSDDNICRVLDTLKRLDIRIERLWLAGNHMAERGCVALTEYVWNSRDALVEIDVADNEIRADPTAGSEPGSDVVSAFLRCIYNHGAYPLMLDHGGLKVLPLLLKMGNNFISHPDKLLRMTRSKGGKSHVRICRDAEPYPRGDEKEYLAICLPDFLAQLTNGVAADNVAPAPVAASPVAPVAAPPVVEQGKRKATHESGKKEKKEKKDGKERKRRKETKDRGEDAPSLAPAVAAEVAADGAEGPNTLGFSEEEQRRLQSDIDSHLKSGGGLPAEEMTRTMLSEFTVCMVVVKKPLQEIAEELVPFVGAYSKELMQWLEGHLEEKYPELMSQLRAAWTN